MAASDAGVDNAAVSGADRRAVVVHWFARATVLARHIGGGGGLRGHVCALESVVAVAGHCVQRVVCVDGSGRGGRAANHHFGGVRARQLWAQLSLCVWRRQ